MSDNSHISKGKAWIVAVDMGYGHQRTAYPLRDVAYGGRIVNANNYKGIPQSDSKVWRTTRSLYESLSRFRRVPIIGLAIFLFFDSFQRILGYYPVRDLSKSNVLQKSVFRFIKRGWGKDLIFRLEKKHIPFVTTFFTSAFMAEASDYQGDIYCVICDADIARAWVTVKPQESRIKYCVPNTWARDRLKLYGVNPENILFTGYPLPKENIGGEAMEIAKKDLGYRLLNLDPSGRYRQLYKPLIKNVLGKLPPMPSHPLTIMFSIGGAGAQKEIALQILNSLKEKIRQKKIRMIISVGVREGLKQYFQEQVRRLNLGGWIHILSGKTMPEYFQKFNQALRTTDVLLTKPSELSFYAGLGIPIIIEPSIGSQEDFNRRWLMHVGAAVLQENPKYMNEWFFDMVNSGDLAEMAMQGFIEIEKMGTYNIEKIVSGIKPVKSSFETKNLAHEKIT